jgi:hypothetical protein
LDHAQYCALKSPKRALVFVAYFLLAGLGGWIGLHKAPPQRDPIILLFAVLFTAVYAKAIVDFTHLRERLAFGIAIIMLAVPQVERYAPSVFGQDLTTERFGRLTLALLGLVISLSMLVQSLTARPPLESASDQDG